METEWIKNMLSYGVATTDMVATSLRNYIRFGVEVLNSEPEPLYNASFGCIDEIMSTTGRGFTFDGRHGLDSLEHCYRNAVIFGSTGSGKSSIVTFNNLFRAYGQSIICHTPSGAEIAVAPYLEAKGYRVYVLDLDSDGNSSVAINILDGIATSSDANRVATQLVKASGLSEGASDKYWSLASISLLQFFLMLLIKQDPKYFNVINLKHLLTVFQAAPEAIDRLVSKAGEPLFTSYKAIIRSNERTLAATVMSATEALSLWNDDKVARLTSISTVDFERFKWEPSILFLKNSTLRSAYIKPVLSLIISNALRVFMEKLPEPGQKPLWCLIDEASSLDLGKEWSNIVSNNRKHRIAIMLMYQNISQIYNSLGQEVGNTVLSNMFSKLYLPGADMRTATELEQLVGKRTTEDKNGREQTVPLMTASRIRMMKPHEGLLVCGANKPYLLDGMLPYYKNPFLKRKVHMEPYEYKAPLIPSTVSLLPIP